MPKVFLVRLTETLANAEGKLANHTPLTERGRRQAELVGQRLSQYDVNACYSSELEANYLTAQIISKALGLIVEKCSELNEIHLGAWDGLLKTEIAEKYPSEWSQFLNPVTEDTDIPEGETFPQVKERAIRKFNEILSRHAPEEILCIVGHGFVNRVILVTLLGLKLTEVWKFNQFNGAINAFEVTEDKVKFQFINDFSHIENARLEFGESITGLPWKQNSGRTIASENPSSAKNTGGESLGIYGKRLQCFLCFTKWD